MTRHCKSNDQDQVPDAAFICAHCQKVVSDTAPGTHHRNHCPWCLWSLHVDLCTHDRRSSCHGLMEPIAISVRYNGEWMIVNRCQKCGIIRTNRIAGDDNELVLMSIAIKPIARPAFPLERLDLSKNRKNK